MPRIADADIIHPIHTGNHKCTFCDAVFKSQKSVTLHEKAKHGKFIAVAIQRVNAGKAVWKARPPKPHVEEPSPQELGFAEQVQRAMANIVVVK